LTRSPLGFGAECVQMTFALRLDDSLQALLAPPGAALLPLAEIAVVPLSFTWSSIHFLNPRVVQHSAPHGSLH
jgi:hypothetical protein